MSGKLFPGFECIDGDEVYVGPKQNFASLADQMRVAAERMDGAARCENHLRALLASWDEGTDSERRESVETALDRLVRPF